jgi:hypothetical protein
MTGTVGRGGRRRARVCCRHARHFFFFLPVNVEQYLVLKSSSLLAERAILTCDQTDVVEPQSGDGSGLISRRATLDRLALPRSGRWAGTVTPFLALCVSRRASCSAGSHALPASGMRPAIRHASQLLRRNIHSR